jgi:hypothetical protein
MSPALLTESPAKSKAAAPSILKPFTPLISESSKTPVNAGAMRLSSGSMDGVVNFISLNILKVRSRCVRTALRPQLHADIIDVPALELVAGAVFGVEKETDLDGLVEIGCQIDRLSGE